MLGAIADEGVVRNLSTVPWPYGESHAREFAGREFDPLAPRFLVTRAADAALVGCIGLTPIADTQALELGYWIARIHWGRGYATEAGRAMLDIARMLGQEEVRSLHFLDNPASGKVLRKLGFEPTGQIVSRQSRARAGGGGSAISADAGRWFWRAPASGLNTGAHGHDCVQVAPVVRSAQCA